jgi:HD-like signal output (HDOD) protein
VTSTRPYPVGSAFATDIYVVEPDDLARLADPQQPPVPRDVQQALHRELSAKVVQVVVAGSFEPPRLPEVALQVMTAADDPDTSADDLAKLIHRDQFLAVRVLRVANSAAYRPSDRRIYSLAQAISRLGFVGTRNVVVSAAMAQAIYRGPHAELLESYWRASVGSAVGFQLIEQTTGGNADAAFLAGLLHNVGKPVLVWILDDLIRTAYADRVAFDDVAPELVHLLHARIGAIIVGSWDGPQGMVDLVAHHHDRLPPARQRMAVRKLRLANLLWELWDADPSVAVLDPGLAAHSAFARCGIEQAAALRILERYPGGVAGMLSS